MAAWIMGGALFCALSVATERGFYFWDLAAYQDQALNAADQIRGVALDGFTLHAATRAGGRDAEGREALLRYVLRPPVARERVAQQPDGLVARLRAAHNPEEGLFRRDGRG